MSAIIKRTLFIISFALLFNACTSTQKVIDEPSAGEESVTESFYPNWYSQNYFMSDSLSYHGYGDAVSADSVAAIANAELQARVNIEKGISDLLEEIRLEIHQNGSEAAAAPEFIIALRRAHQQVEMKAEDTARQAKSDDSIFKGYAKVSISKTELLALLQANLSANQWNLISSAPQFSEELN